MSRKWMAYTSINGSQRKVYAEIENDNWSEAHEVFTTLYGNDVYGISRVRSSSGSGSSNSGDVEIMPTIIGGLIGFIIVLIFALSHH